MEMTADRHCIVAMTRTRSELAEKSETGSAEAAGFDLLKRSIKRLL